MSGVSDKCKREFAQSLPNTSVVVEVQGRRENVTGIKRYFCETQASPGANTPHRREETDSRSSRTMLGSHDAGFRRTMTGQPLPGNGPRIRFTGTAQPRAIRARSARGERRRRAGRTCSGGGARRACHRAADHTRTGDARRVQAPNACQGLPGSTAPVPVIPCLVPVFAIVMSFSTAATNAR